MSHCDCLQEGAFPNVAYVYPYEMSSWTETQEGPRKTSLVEPGDKTLLSIPITNPHMSFGSTSRLTFEDLAILDVKFLIVITRS